MMRCTAALAISGEGYSCGGHCRARASCKSRAVAFIRVRPGRTTCTKQLPTTLRRSPVDKTTSFTSRAVWRIARTVARIAFASMCRRTRANMCGALLCTVSVQCACKRSNCESARVCAVTPIRPRLICGISVHRWHDSARPQWRAASVEQQRLGSAARHRRVLCQACSPTWARCGCGAVARKASSARART